MGDSLSKEYEDAEVLAFLSSLTFITKAQNSIFGPITIYKMQEKPYEYIMRKTYKGLENDTTLEDRTKVFKSEGISACRTLVTPDFIKCMRYEGTCGQQLKLQIFCRYYFFTLSDMIVKKIMFSQVFDAEELCYIIQKLLESFRQLHINNNSYLGLLKADKIFLNPLGMLRIYPATNLWLQEAMKQEQLNQQAVCSTGPSSQINIKIKPKKALHGRILYKSLENDLEDLGLLITQLYFLKRIQPHLYDNLEYRRQLFHKLMNERKDGDFRLFIVQNFIKGIFEDKKPIHELQNWLQNLIKDTHINRVNYVKMMGNDQEQDRLKLTHKKTAHENSLLAENSTQKNTTSKQEIKDDKSQKDEKQRPKLGGLTRIKKL